MTDPHDPTGPSDPTMPQSPVPQAAPAGAGGVPTGGPPAAASPPSAGIGGLLATIVVMLLVGGAIGYFGGPVVLEDDDEDTTEVATADDDADSTTTVPAADPNAWTELEGTFQASLPEGMDVRSSIYGVGQRALIARPTAGAKLFESGGINLMFDRRPDMTPEKELDIDPPADCPTAEPREPYSYGEFTGFSEVYSGCPGGEYVVRRVAVAVPGGTNLLLSIGQTPDDDTLVEQALDTFDPEVAADTQVAPPAPCTEIEDSPEAEWPLSLEVTNYLDDTVSQGWLNQDTGQVEQPQELPSGYNTGTRYTKEGDVFRFTTPTGDQDYTATAEKYQCVYLTSEGFVTAPS